MKTTWFSLCDLSDFIIEFNKIILTNYNSASKFDQQTSDRKHHPTHKQRKL